MADGSQGRQGCANLGKSRGHDQLSGRLNEPGPEPARWGHLSPSYAKENSSPRRDRKEADQVGLKSCPGHVAPGGCESVALSEAAPSRGLHGPGCRGPTEPEALIWVHCWVERRD